MADLRLRFVSSPRHASLALAGAAALSLACVSPATNAQEGIDPPAAFRTFTPSLPVSAPPYDDLMVSWMQRLDQPYVYVDHYGSYTETGAHLPALLREMRVQGIEADGPPFCLFYDDPAKVPTQQLTSRACIPISSPRSPKTPLRYDVLPSRMVAYGFVSGPYPNVPRAYPKVFEYMAAQNFVADGPIREVYYHPPATARSSEDYLCEIQVPLGRRSE